MYQLKKLLEQYDEASSDGPPTHLLVDEYQDLNRCDLAVVAALASRGAEVYAAGDDDQSIYGFRMAHPEGIRRFPRDYPSAASLQLELCKRCAPNILELALFVARQDYRRIDKVVKAEEGRLPGRVELLRFQDQHEEAEHVANLCTSLLAAGDMQPHEILILLRSDHHAAFSIPLRQSLTSAGVEVAVPAAVGPLDTEDGRVILALLRLAVNEHDHLAWRTALQLRRNQVGSAAIGKLYEHTRISGGSFSQALEAVAADPTALPRFGSGLAREVRAIRQAIDALRVETGAADVRPQAVSARLQALNSTPADDAAHQAALQYLETIEENVGAHSAEGLLQAIGEVEEFIEQDIQEGKVNILTMHRAKGLTAQAVIIVGAEDEQIPGRATGDAIDDERRLLYVSMTRAVRLLTITYCTRRSGAQAHTGRNPGQARRSLTRFLRDGPISPDGASRLKKRLAELSR